MGGPKRKRNRSKRSEEANGTKKKMSRLGVAPGSEAEDTVTPEVKNSPFDTLPLEMKEHILEHLNYADGKRAKGVCAAFREIVDRKTKIAFSLNDDSLETFVKMDECRVIDVLKVEDFHSRLGVISRSRCNLTKIVRHLCFLPTKGVSLHKLRCEFCGSSDCPENEDWIPGKGNSEDNIVTLLRLYNEIEHLTFGPMSLEHVRNSKRFKSIRMENLTKLDLLLGDDFDDVLIHDDSPVTTYTNFLSNFFPSLKTFNFNNQACSKQIQLLFSVYEFISRHHQTLDDIQINSERSYEYAINPLNITRWTGALDRIRDQIKLVQPKTLTVRTATIFPLDLEFLKKFEEQFLSCQTRLEKVVISSVDSELKNVLGFLPACARTLKSLKIDSGVYRLRSCSLDCGLLKDCSKLTYLDLDIDDQQSVTLFPWDRTESSIENVHLLPQSITELRIEGHLPKWKCITMLQRLPRLRKFTSMGNGGCKKNGILLKVVLKYAAVEVFVLHDDKCPKLIEQSQRFVGKGLEMKEICSGFEYKIDRSLASAFDRDSITV